MGASETSTIKGSQIFEGTVTFVGDVYFPAETVDDDSFTTNALKRLSQEKVVQRPDLVYGQSDGSAVVAETKLLRIAQGDGTVLAVNVRPTSLPTSSKQYSIDIQVAEDGSNTWTSILTAPIVINASSTANTLELGTLVASPDYDSGCAIRVVVAVSGSGTQGQGFQVTVGLAEQPL